MWWYEIALLVYIINMPFAVGISSDIWGRTDPVFWKSVLFWPVLLLVIWILVFFYLPLVFLRELIFTMDKKEKIPGWFRSTADRLVRILPRGF